LDIIDNFVAGHFFLTIFSLVNNYGLSIFKCIFEDEAFEFWLLQTFDRVGVNFLILLCILAVMAIRYYYFFHLFLLFLLFLSLALKIHLFFIKMTILALSLFFIFILFTINSDEFSTWAFLFIILIN
jgi:hypothetical protein